VDGAAAVNGRGGCGDSPDMSFFDWSPLWRAADERRVAPRLREVNVHVRCIRQESVERRLERSTVDNVGVHEHAVRVERAK